MPNFTQNKKEIMISKIFEKSRDINYFGCTELVRPVFSWTVNLIFSPNAAVCNCNVDLT